MSANFVRAVLVVLVFSAAPLSGAPAPALRRPSEAEKLFREGRDAYLGRTKPIDYPRALKLFRQAAAKGHPLGAAWAGRLLCSGKGCAKDEVEGLKLVKAAMPAVRKWAENDNVTAQATLGLFLANGWGMDRDDKEAVAWYRKAVENGDVGSMNNLGVMYNAGRGVAKDQKEGANWYRKAVEKGSVIATFNLGYVYLVGQGIEPDNKEAMRLFKKASEKGHAAATYNVAWMYELGRGVDSDRTEAIVWYKKAAGLGDDGAKKRLEILENGQ